MAVLVSQLCTSSSESAADEELARAAVAEEATGSKLELIEAAMVGFLETPE
jgi:hypothetical protein